MGLFEKTVSSKVVFEGRVVTVRLDTAELINGKEVRREVVEHPGGVAIIPVDENKNVIAVRQFRYPLNIETVEVPAGKLEYGEDPLECAVRELGEEVGATAGRIIDLGRIYPSPGFCTEVLYLYLALDLTYGESHPDEDEFLNVVKIPLSEFVGMVMKDEIRDGKTVAAVLKADYYLK